MYSLNNIGNTVTKYLADLQNMYFKRARYQVLPTFSSKQSMITEGYFFVSHRKNAGTPILKSTKVYQQEIPKNMVWFLNLVWKIFFWGNFPCEKYKQTNVVLFLLLLRKWWTEFDSTQTSFNKKNVFLFRKELIQTLSNIQNFFW